ncbi:putative FHY3/FAR1 family protein [Helianthus anomalus]
MTDKKQYLADYSFEYSVDDGKRLTGLFWADGLCKLNYMEFGDVISFDATFKTNRQQSTRWCLSRSQALTTTVGM